MDATLGSLAREEMPLPLRFGRAREVVSRGCFELGSRRWLLDALERCERSVHWEEAARCLARRVEKPTEVRWATARRVEKPTEVGRATAIGKVSWIMGELLACVAQPVDEAHWVDVVESRTVRQSKVGSRCLRWASPSFAAAAPSRAERARSASSVATRHEKPVADDALRAHALLRLLRFPSTSRASAFSALSTRMSPTPPARARGRRRARDAPLANVREPSMAGGGGSRRWPAPGSREE
jgi:hypothetical protein